VTDVTHHKEEPLTKAIGYCRVSTKAQGANGYSLPAQRDAIEKHCAANKFDLVGFIPDVMSGGKADRLHGRAAAVAAIRNHVADARD
jgi:DNA invertase Pin-like site-specific DNA recombinase